MANQARGFLEEVRLIFETTFNTTPTVNPGDMVQIYRNGGGLDSDENMIDPETIIPGQRDMSEVVFGNISVGGNYTIPLDVRTCAYFFKLLMGAPTTSGAGPYTHDFAPSNDLPSVTIDEWHSDVGVSRVFNGVKINNMNLNFEVNTELVAEMEMLGGKENPSSATPLDSAPVTQTLTRFNAKSIVFKKGGVNVTVAKSLNVAISNDLYDDNFTLSSNGFRTELVEQRFMVDISGTLVFDDEVWLDHAINGDELDLEIEATNGAHTLTFTFPEVKLRRVPLERNGHGPQYIPIEGKAYYQDSVEGSTMQIQLVNDVASYA